MGDEAMVAILISQPGLPMAPEHGVRHPHPPGALVVHQDALRLRPVVLGPCVLAVDVGRVAQEKERHHRKERVPHCVHPALFRSTQRGTIGRVGL